MKLQAVNGYSLWINPSFEEALDIIEKRPDTLRIGADDSRDCLAVVTGNGSTHATIARTLGEMRQSRPSRRDNLRYSDIGRCLVLYTESGRVWCCDDELDGEYTRPAEVASSLNATRQSFINLVEAMKLLCVKV